MNPPQLILKESNPNISKDQDSLKPNEQQTEFITEEKSQEILIKVEQEEVEEDEDQEVLDEQLQNLNNKQLKFNDQGDKQLTSIQSTAPHITQMALALDKDLIQQDIFQSGTKITNFNDYQIGSSILYSDFLSRQAFHYWQNNKINDILEDQQLTHSEGSQQSEGVLRDYIKKISTKTIFSVVDLSIEASARWSIYLQSQNFHHLNQNSMLLNKQINPFNQFYNQISHHNPIEEELNHKNKNKISIDLNQTQKQSQTSVNTQSNQNLEVEKEDDIQEQEDKQQNNQQKMVNQSQIDLSGQFEEYKKEEKIINQKEGVDEKDQEKSTTLKIINMDVEEYKQNQKYPEIQLSEIPQKNISNQQELSYDSKENDSVSINKITNPQQMQMQKNDSENKENQQNIEKENQPKKSRKQSQSSSQGILEIGNSEFDKSLSKKSRKKSKILNKEQDKLQRLSLENSMDKYSILQEYMHQQNMNNPHQQALMFAPLFGSQNPYLPPNTQIPPYLDTALHSNSFEFPSQFNPYIPQVPEVSTLYSQQNNNNNNWNNHNPLVQGTTQSHTTGISQLPPFPGQLQNPLFLQALNQQILQNQARDLTIDHRVSQS